MRDPDNSSERLGAGTVLAGRYRIADHLGSWHGGEVYLAEDLQLQVRVTLTLLPGVAEDERRLARLRDDVSRATEVIHADMGRIYALIEDGGRHFAVAELIDGDSLESLRGSSGKLAPERVVEIGRSVAAGLAAAHAAGVLHGALTPASVLLDRQGRARVADLGLAAGAGCQDADYQAPELAAGREATPKSDLYAFGVLLYELLTGEKPRRTAAPDLPSRRAGGVDPALERVVMKSLATDPGNRPTAEEAANVLAAASVSWRPEAGEDVPHRRYWELVKKLGKGGLGETWLAVHRTSGEARVFKFALEASRLKAVNRTVALFRRLKETLGPRDDIAAVRDWNVDETPYFIEMEYVRGGNLIAWAEARGGLLAVPFELRLELIAQAAEVLAAAHSVGVLHKNVKPSNLLVDTGTDEDTGRAPRLRVADFGISAVLERAQRTTADGVKMTEETAAVLTGTRLCMAPEVVSGGPSTVQADVYAIGVLLYQVVVGDFHRTPVAGWRRHVSDEFLANDIADLTEPVPERRPGCLRDVAERLRTLDARRTIRDAERRKHAEAEAALEALDEALRQKRFFKALALTALAALVVMALAWAAT